MRIPSVFAAATVALLISACTTPSQLIADAQLESLCKSEAGVFVYQTVPLPSERFDKHGRINFFKPTQGEAALGADYGFYRKRETLKTHNAEPLLVRSTAMVVRKIDNTVLGRAVVFSRIGGDFPGPWHPSSKGCAPELDGGESALFRAVFTKVGSSQ